MSKGAWEILPCPSIPNRCLGYLVSVLLLPPRAPAQGCVAAKAGQTGP